jgi:dynein heavy chain 1
VANPKLPEILISLPPPCAVVVIVVMQWTDGVFTHLLRKILANVRGEDKQRHWIVFDGDVDPEWAENLNSVLDENRVLTLPNGERLRLSSNVRIIMEVQSLQYATLASVSRCGMVWFSEDTLPLVDIFQHKLNDMSIAERDGESGASEGVSETVPAAQTSCINALQRFLGADEIIYKAVLTAEALPHVMATTRVQMVHSVFALLARGVSLVLEYNESHPDFPKTDEQIAAFMGKWTLYSLLWGLGSSMYLAGRLELSAMLCRASTVAVPSRLDASHGADSGLSGDALDLSTPSLLDYEVQINDGAWHLWKERVPAIDIEPHQVLDTDVIVPTVDTVRHAHVLEGWLEHHVPVVLCGPPGSGKTMSLIAVVQSSGKYDMASLNFSSATTPSLILKTFEQYCEVHSTRRGLVMSPRVPNKWLVVFCDEINLPANDNYGTQTVITFMRQLVEQRGFWRPSDNQWVHVERVQFVGACNPPTDAGRVVMSDRFLRHTPVLLVDYPAPESLMQIYGTFVRALLKVQPVMRAHTEPLTQAMVASYEVNRKRFTADQQPHYVYSPRELSRWTRALFKAVQSADGMKLEDLVRLWLHEGYRLFQDRLVTAEERQW